MTVLDTSAVVAVVREEADGPRLLEALIAADVIGIGTPTMVEASVVLRRRFGWDGQQLFLTFLSDWAVVVIPFGRRHWKMAARASGRYGKGHHPAALNFGDCMTYATAQVAGAPLLFTGEDFARTDVAAA